MCKVLVANCAHEDFRFKLKSVTDPKAELSQAETAAIGMLRDEVVSVIETFTEDKPCAEAIYAVAKKAGIEGKDLFRAAYQVLIGKDQGPRLANFLRIIDKGRIVDIMSAY